MVSLGTARREGRRETAGEVRRPTRHIPECKGKEDLLACPRAAAVVTAPLGGRSLPGLLSPSGSAFPCRTPRVSVRHERLRRGGGERLRGVLGRSPGAPRPADLRLLQRHEGPADQHQLVPGLRHCWKDPNNEFRKNLHLTGVPTLLKYGTPQKLVEQECFKPELVRMLFTED
uniref:Thioredoxin domain-containing protein n=1 Tax=Podarcis muralis TaxID=64176 RepID=A0A670JSA3_PODMU